LRAILGGESVVMAGFPLPAVFGRGRIPGGPARPSCLGFNSARCIEPGPITLEPRRREDYLEEMKLIESPDLLSAEREDIVRRAQVHERYNFLGNGVELRGNVPGPIENFSSMYKLFLADGAPSASDTPIRLYFYQQETAEGPVLTMLVGGHVVRVRDAEILSAPFSIFSYLILLQVHSHYLVHGGCVALNGRGIVLSGDSKMGKTTLVSHLVTRGAGFLSDELAPISRRECYVEPFPRRLCIREGPAKQLVREDIEEMVWAVRDDRRQLVRVEELMGGREPVGRVPLRAVLFLSTRPEGDVATPMKFAQVIRVALTERTDALEAELARIPGLTIVERHSQREFPEFLLRTEQPGSLLPQLKALVERHGVEFAEMRYENLEGPDFEGRPKIVPIAAAAGVIELIKKMPGAFKNELVKREFDGKLARMVAELSSIVGDVRFYRFMPGRLEEMIELVEALDT